MCDTRNVGFSLRSHRPLSDADVDVPLEQGDAVGHRDRDPGLAVERGDAAVAFFPEVRESLPKRAMVVEALDRFVGLRPPRSRRFDGLPGPGHQLPFVRIPGPGRRGQVIDDHDVRSGRARVVDRPPRVTHLVEAELEQDHVGLQVEVVEITGGHGDRLLQPLCRDRCFEPPQAVRVLVDGDDLPGPIGVAQQLSSAGAGVKDGLRPEIVERRQVPDDQAEVGRQAFPALPRAMRSPWARHRCTTA